MTHSARYLPLALIGAIAVLAACGAGGDTTSTSAAANPPPAQEEGLPAGHPTLSTPPSADSVITPPPPGSGTGEAGLAWTVPEGWISETPSSAMRRAQYRIPGAAGDGELVVFYFGPGQGGDAMSNAVRWANQFGQPDGRPSEEALKTERIMVGDIPVLLTEIVGTYSGGMTMMGGQSAELDNHMLLGAVAEGGDANWFFKCTGPAATLTAEREAFRLMIDSLARGGA
jgi:hypothetical protein